MSGRVRGYSYSEYIRRRSVDEMGFTTLREGMMLFMEAELS